MTHELWEIVNEYRNKGVSISDGEAMGVRDFCLRKMKVAKIQNQEEYLPLLYADELKNHLFRLAVNATTMLLTIEKEMVL